MDPNINLLDWYWEMPPVTRAYFTASTVSTVLCALDVISPYDLYLNPRQVRCAPSALNCVWPAYQFAIPRRWHGASTGDWRRTSCESAASAVPLHGRISSPLTISRYRRSYFGKFGLDFVFHMYFLCVASNTPFPHSSLFSPRPYPLSAASGTAALSRSRPSAAALRTSCGCSSLLAPCCW